MSSMRCHPIRSHPNWVNHLTWLTQIRGGQPASSCCPPPPAPTCARHRPPPAPGRPRPPLLA